MMSNKGNIDANGIVQEMKNKYRVKFTENIKGVTGGKFDVYAKIKRCHDRENYLTEIKNDKHRRALTKLRIGAYNLKQVDILV